MPGDACAHSAESSRRRRPPPRELLVAVAWLCWDLAVLTYGLTAIFAGDTYWAYPIIVALTLLTLPHQWRVFRDDLERWGR